MNFAKVIGTIWATQKNHNLTGEKLQIIQPLDSKQKPIGNSIVAVDKANAGTGDLIFYVSSREAILPLDNMLTPIDATIVGIVDKIDL